LDQQGARSTEPTPRPKRQAASNEVPRELVLTLLAQGYPLEELLEYFPMFTLDQLMLLLDDEVSH
jgi:hypothetical protein